jgi:hypothetical protein
MNYRERIVRNPRICGGKPVFKVFVCRSARCSQALRLAIRRRPFGVRRLAAAFRYIKPSLAIPGVVSRK